MSDAWDYGPGADSGWNFSGGGGSDWFSGAMGGLGDLIGHAGKVYADTWAQKTLMQQNQNGLQYLEGQRLAQQQLLMQSGVSPLILIAGGALLFFMMVKD